MQNKGRVAREYSVQLVGFGKESIKKVILDTPPRANDLIEIKLPAGDTVTVQIIMLTRSKEEGTVIHAVTKRVLKGEEVIPKTSVHVIFAQGILGVPYKVVITDAISGKAMLVEKPLKVTHNKESEVTVIEEIVAQDISFDMGIPTESNYETRIMTVRNSKVTSEEIEVK